MLKNKFFLPEGIDLNQKKKYSIRTEIKDKK
jgi:hypothetical protein